MQILLTWLGRTDLDQMKLDRPASIATIALKGPAVDQIVILASTWDDEWHDYQAWLKKKLACIGRSTTDVSIQRVRLPSPIDYALISKIMLKQLAQLPESCDKCFINLTSGTPAMTVVSVLLGKSNTRCELVQTSPKGELIHVDIPINFATEYRKSADVAIEQLTSSSAFNTVTANSEIMKRVVSRAEKLACTDLPALLLGESGTGKEVMANAIHTASTRKDKPFRIVNCGALPESLVDSILFGHVKGAFTGAIKDHAGLFEQAHGGTLFLDEVGELPLSVQVKLLRTLQQKEIIRVGDNEVKHVDVRIIAATHRDLLSMVSEGRFREDLFYRLAVGVVTLPALRERHDDISILIDELMVDINQQMETHPLFECKNISASAINFATSYSWPGNIRELWNTLNRAVLWSDSTELSRSDLENAIISRDVNTASSNFKIPGDLNQYIDTIKKKEIENALSYAGGNKSKAAKALGLKNHQTLNNWLKEVES